MLLNHPETIPSILVSRKNYLSRNWSLMLKIWGTVVLHYFHQNCVCSASLGSDLYFKEHIQQAARKSTPHKNYQDWNPTVK